MRQAFVQVPGKLVALALGLGLAGCIDLAPDFSPVAQEHGQFARREGVSLAGASVAFMSMEGAPDAVAAGFNRQLAGDAAARGIAVADAKAARYLVRGYLSATPSPDGATLEYVWDIFTPDKRRVQRLSDALVVKGQGDDAWQIVGQPALASVAARSADDLAAYLSNTPEAVASAKPAAEAPLRPLSYAPLQ